MSATPAPSPRLFVSTMLYAASKRLGYMEATQELLRQAGALDPNADDHAGIAAALTLARVVALEGCQLNVNAGATVIGKGRSLAAAEFLASAADVWLSVDDDVSVSVDALQAAISQARAEPCLVGVPCLLRSTVMQGGNAPPTVNIRAGAVAVQARAPSGGKIETVDAVGFGCFSVSRAVVERMHEHAGKAGEFRHEGKLVRRLFWDGIYDQEWLTDDFVFCNEVKGLGFKRWAVRVGTSVHAGQRLDLATLDAMVLRGADRVPALGSQRLQKLIG